MRHALAIAVGAILAWGGPCPDHPVVEKVAGRYEIRLAGPAGEDMDLDAKWALYEAVRKERGVKGNFRLVMSGFLEMERTPCEGGELHRYEVPVASVKVLPPGKRESREALRKRIVEEIAEIEGRENLSTGDLRRLYGLYFSLGRIEESSAVMDRLMEREMEEW